MAKRGLSADDTKSPSKKRVKSGEQARLDTFLLSSSPIKQRLAHPSVSSSTAAQLQSDRAEGDSPSRPLIIDIDADETGAEIVNVSPSARKGKIAQRQPTESRLLQFLSLNVDPIDYSPDEQPWLESGAPYAFLAHTFSTLSETRSRIIIINALTNCLRTVIVKHPESLLPSLYLLSNTLAPPYIPVELGLGPSIISRAIQNVSGTTPATLKRLYNTLGDPGDVAMSAKSNLRTLVPHLPLTIASVYGSLLRIAHSKGQGAAKQKEKLVEKLLLSANGEEVRYLTRTLCQNIRVGAVRTSVLTALARAIVLCQTSSGTPDDPDVQAPRALLAQVQGSNLGPKRSLDPALTKLNAIFSKAEALIKQVFVKHPNYDDIVNTLLDTGLSGLDERVPLTIGLHLFSALHIDV
jgi:DNA ligase-1